MHVMQPGFELQELPSLMSQHSLPSGHDGNGNLWETECLASCAELDEDEKAYLRKTPEAVDKIIVGRMVAVDDISALIMHDRDTISGPRNFAKAVDALDGKGTHGKLTREEAMGKLHPLDTPEEALLRAKEASALRDAEFAATHPPLPERVKRYMENADSEERTLPEG